MSFTIGSWKFDHLSLFRLVYRSFQLLGYFPSSVQSSGWKSRLHKYFKWFHITLCIFMPISHFLSTIVHSVHYLPEFFTCLLEDVTIITVFIIVGLLRYRVHRFESVIHYMETSFSTVDTRVLAECHRRSLTTVVMFVTLFMMAVAGILAEFFTPMTEDELKLREELHGIKREAKRALFNLWIPGIDRSQSWTYVVICMVQVRARSHLSRLLTTFCRTSKP
uniref:Uncharacterized protein n=1 Tax=Cacopsylla melanoneura TaxID=428564 RepID=A0A8D8QM98_9HEMI